MQSFNCLSFSSGLTRHFSIGSRTRSNENLNDSSSQHFQPFVIWTRRFRSSCICDSLRRSTEAGLFAKLRLLGVISAFFRRLRFGWVPSPPPYSRLFEPMQGEWEQEVSFELLELIVFNVLECRRKMRNEPSRWWWWW